MSTDLNFGNLTIDLSDSSLLTDTISISPSSFNWGSSAYTISAGATGSAYTVGIGGAGANGSSWYTTSAGFNGTSSATVDVGTTGIEVKNGADIKINGKSLSDFMDRVESRLGILQPKPELLDKFEALKLAYEHYKTLEALCMGDIPKDPNGK